MRAFITGSRAYGTPTEESDLDLCILMEESDITELWMHGLADGGSCRFGKLNLITFSNQDRFNLWKAITEKLRRIAPVTRDYAVAAFQAEGFCKYGEDNLEILEVDYGERKKG